METVVVRNQFSFGHGIDPPILSQLAYRRSARVLLTSHTAAYQERIDLEKIRSDLQNGALVNVDGTINLVDYSA